MKIDMKVIGIIGTRRRDDFKSYKLVEEQFFKLYKEDEAVLCSGGCPQGADKFAEKISRKFGIPIIIIPPNWKKYGRGAGFVRNGQIAEASDELIACVAINRLGGTEDTIKKFLKDHSKDDLYLV
ncbi:DUF2493 domain-containing protein [Candidatus Pacearchaeota archaeon]|nr:DUF2493 domain-containing protein [Candidatus Pacearchaeota archaeon]